MMQAYLGISKARYGCTNILRLGEVCLYQKDQNYPDEWITVIGDGKTSVADLPPLASYDIYTRVAKLEEEIEILKKQRNSNE